MELSFVEQSSFWVKYTQNSLNDIGLSIYSHFAFGKTIYQSFKNVEYNYGKFYQFNSIKLYP